MDQTLILELSSDEEVGFDNSSSADNFDWITKLIQDDDTPNFNEGLIYNNNNNDRDNDNDEDDVVVLGEVIVEKPKKAKSRNYGDDDDDDDDCVVLDGDPDKGKDEEVKDDDKIDNICEKDEDDLVIVGEKGQVACRDFPHARHSCAKYPFSSTPHQNRCALCHCYVCDSLAPCPKWGSGMSSTDHCHATDKKEYWKLERTRFRQLKTPSLPPIPSTNPNSGSLSLSSQLPQIPRVPLRLPTNAGIPSTISPIRVSRRYRSSIPVSSNKFQPHLLSRQLPRSWNNGNLQIPSNRSSNFLSGPRLVSSCPVFKRSGITNRPVTTSRDPPRFLQMPCQQSTGQFTDNNSNNSRILESNPGFLPPSTNNVSPTLSNLHMQDYSHPIPHNTPTYTYESMNQSRNIPGQTLNTQQHLSITRNISSPNPYPLSIPQPTRQTWLEHSQSSPVLSCTTSNPLNFVSPNCQQPTVEKTLVRGGGIPMQELLPSIEQNGLPSNNDSEVPLPFDIDYWLQDGGPVFDLFDDNNQGSGTEPVDPGMLYFDFETSMKGLQVVT